MSYTPGLSINIITTAPNSGSLWILTSEMTPSECWPGSYYGQGCWEEKSGSQSHEWNLQTSDGAWVNIHLAMGVVQVTSVPGSWHQLAVVVSYKGDSLRRLIALGGNTYDTG